MKLIDFILKLKLDFMVEINLNILYNYVKHSSELGNDPTGGTARERFFAEFS